MKIRRILLITIFCFATFSLSIYSQTFENKEAEKKVAGSKLIRFDPKNKSIKFIQLKSDYFYSATDQPNWLNKSLKFSKKHAVKLLHKSVDKKGFTHSKYQIYFQNIPVEGSVYTVHSINEKVHCANGEFIQGQNVSVTPSLTEKQAFDKAILYVNAKNYKWEPENSSRPVGELTILPVDSIYILAYKFDIYAIDPLSRQYIFVNATTGEIIKALNRIHISNATGTAKTMYNGVVSITTDSYNGSYRLRETGRGNGIETYNLNHGTSYSSATDFTNADNNWTDTIDCNHAANDAHYATEATYDYYYSKFGRNSYDDNGAKIKSYVHYSRNYVNAFWDGSSMTYGDGDGVTYLPLTPIEVVGHEITHGVTEHSAGLIYAGESGALNESFSDIFGVIIDFFKNPTKANYLMGDAMSVTHTPFRSMQNPKDFQNPNTYRGIYWDPNQEVHTNSGVQNYWFYLICEGGTGTNDIGNNYSIVGIGREKAAQIAYRNLTVYLTPSSTYADARFYSIQSAIDLYGDCSSEVIAVTNAWYAVGVGTSYDNSVIADFVASKTSACNTNSPIYFFNRSTKANTFSWDFGDGQTDTARNPVHTYTSLGTYTVHLFAQGNASCNNNDTIIKQNLISVTSGQAPVAANCIPHTLYPGSGGIYQFTLNTISNTTKGSKDDYRDYSCSNQATVSEGRDYTLNITVGTSHQENVRLWIDLNNNGRFDDVGELAYQKEKVSGSFSDKIIIPKGVTYNTPLRFRVASDYTGYPLLSSCNNSNFGQFQDYGVTIQQNNSKTKANFSSNLQLIAKADTVQFKDETLNLPSTWQWSFPGGNPSTSALQNPSVIYSTAGTYTASLIVSNSYGTDTIIKRNYIKVLDQLYCTSSLGGGSCPGDISLVSIKGTALNNINHDGCNSTNGSIYASYPSTGNNTATLDADTTYKLSVTATNYDIISVWIDFNQNGVFEASEWTQVTTYSTPNTPAQVNIRIPSGAIMGKTGMRIRSRNYGNSNGAYDACSTFGSGITEDYFVTINNLPRPRNLSAAIKNNSTGQVELNWTYTAALKAENINKNVANLTFTRFRILRNGQAIDSTINTTYTDNLPGFGGYKYEVKAIYDSGESGSSGIAAIGWYGNPQITVTPTLFNEVLVQGDSVSRTMTISNTGNGLLIFNIGKENIIGLNASNYKYETFKSGTSLFTNQNSKSGNSISDTAFVKRVINSKTINPNGLENILVFEGLYASTIYHYDNVLNKLGLSRTLVNNWSDLGTQLTNGTNWNLVIVNSYSSIAPANILDQLELYRSMGGKLIYADWSIFNYSSHPLLAGLGARWVSNIYTPLNFSATDSTHTLFNHPNKISHLNWSQDQSNLDGQIFEVLPGSAQLASFNGYPSSGAIIYKNNGNSILNAFQALNYDRDDNGNGVTDIEELIENEIALFGNGSLSNWLSANPSSDTLSNGQSATITVKFNAKKLSSGSYADTLEIVHTSLLKPNIKVPCTLRVLGKPTTNFQSDRNTIGVGSSIQFTDLSTGDPTQWNWNFPGGTPNSSTSKNPLITYNSSGSFDVALIAKNAYGSDTLIKKGFITVLPKLVANFYASTTTTQTGSYVYFYDSSTNNPTSWKWTFTGGNPSTSTSSNPYVVYNSPGIYDVKLVVYNAGGSDSITKIGYITITLPPKPIANFSASNTNILIGSYAYFYDNSTNSPNSWKWTFTGGSPSSSTSSNPYVAYNTPGIYDVKLVVTNAGGSDSITRTAYVTVSPPPKPIASFSSSTMNAITGSTVYFYDNSSNSPTIRKWIFSGGTPSTSTSSYPSIQYNFPGVYDVKLVVSNAGGADSIVNVGYITVTTLSKPVANFYSNLNKVTTASGLYFYDNSANSPTNWKWTFQGGSPSTSTSSNPYVNYSNPGTYDVKLVVSNMSGSDSIVKTGYISVSLPPKPVAEFMSNANTVTTGTYVSFSDLSTNSPTNWRWIFSGGTPSSSTSSNPSVTYNSIGSYDVKLVVMNAGGSDSITKTGIINVVSALPGDNCSNAQDLSLLTSPYSSSTVGYKSDFTFCNLGYSPDRIFYIDVPNDSTLSIGQIINEFDSRHTLRVGGTCPGTTELACFDDPDVQTHTYKNTTGTTQRTYFILGGYSSSSYGKFTLAWSLSKSVKSVANFSADRITVPINTNVNFTDLSTGMPTFWNWFFTGGTPLGSNLTNPSVYYTVPGTYDVKLVASNSFGSDSITKLAYITVTAPPKPIANFYSGSTKVVVGSSIYFYDNSTNSPTSWKWTFTGGTPSLSTSSSSSVVYNTPGLYSVKLVVSNSGGNDSIEKIQYITVTAHPKPMANFYTSQTKIITGNNVYFYDNSGNSPTSWKWTFTGGDPSTSASSSPYVVYNTPGTYDVKLVVTNSTGSDSITKIGYITVALPPKPVANFSASSTSIVAGSYAYFYDNSTNSPISWKWTFTGGSPTSSTSSNPYVVYNIPGTYDVKLVAANAGGSDSITKTSFIVVTPPPKPIANFSSSTVNTITGSTVNFYDYSSNSPTSRKWTFTGATPSTSTSSSVSVQYNSPGVYDVKLVVSNQGGADSIVKVGYITVTTLSKPVANFYSNINKVTTVSGLYFYDNSANSPTNWKWTFQGGSPSTSYSSNPYVSYVTPGTYDVKLVVSNMSGADSITKTGFINVSLPPKSVANFTSNATTVITGTNVSFSDLSTNSPAQWRWVFNGGTPSSSTYSSPSVTYNSIGSYDVKLVVMNAGGSDSIIKTGMINVVSVLPGDNCSNAQDLSLLTSPYTSSTAGYKSDFSFCNMGYSADRVFYIDVPNNITLNIGQINNDFDSRHTLRVGGACPGTTEIACVDDPDTQNHSYTNTSGVTQRVYFVLGGYGSSSAGKFTLAWRLLSPAKPVANFSSDNTTINQGNSISFADQSTGVPTSWKWYFIGGSPSFSTSSNPYIYYNIPGTYDVKLVASNSFGSDSITKLSYITVSAPPKPVANFYAGSTRAVVGSSIYFNDNSTNSPTSWKWTFTGGTPLSSTSSSQSVLYTTPGLYTVKLVVSNAGGKDSIEKMKFITISAQPKPIANFYTDQSKILTGNYASFYDNSGNNPTSWKWTFTGGNPSTSTYSNPSVIYNLPGVYNVKLVVFNSAGSDSITKNGYILVTLPPKPVANFYASSTSITAGSYAYFYNNSTNSPTSWKWTFTGGSPSTSTSSSTSVKYDLPGIYDVKLVVSNAGGTDSITKLAYITVNLPPKPVVNFYASSTSGTAASYFYFYDYSSNSPTSWKWSFTGGNPSTSTSQSPSVQYSKPGIYDVKLVVSNAGGKDSVTRYGYITVTLPPKPAAYFYASSTNVSIGSNVYFYDNSTNSPTSWRWKFTGGSPSSSTYSNPSVVYNSPGTYDVKLVVANAGGADSIVKVGYINVATASYCTYSLGGSGNCPGDITFVSIKGTTLNNTVHNMCSTSNSSTYGAYPASGATTANLESGKTYELSVTSSNSDIISVWIDYNQNGMFDASEWNQVTTSSSPNVASKINILVPQAAKTGRTGMRIRSRTAGNINGSGDACSYFGSGITEDYTVSFNAIKGFEANKTKVCKSDTVVFTSLYIGNTYSWDFGEGASPRTSSFFGPVSVVYNSSGLKTASLIVDAKDSIVRSNYINVNYPDVYRLNAVTSYCYGSATSISLIGSSLNTSYQLVKDGVNFGSPKIGTGIGFSWPSLTKGSYCIVAKLDSANCTAYFPDTLKITEKPIPNTPVINQNNNILTSNFELGNQWYFNEKGVITEARSNTFEPNQTGNYYTKVTENGCESLPSNVINVIVTGIDGIRVNTIVTLFPNPFFDKLFIKSDNEIAINKIEIRNSVGSIVQKENLSNKRDVLFSIDVSNLNVGYYTVVLYTDSETITYKVFKIK